MELDRWSLAEVSVAVEPLWHDLEHTIRIKPVSRVKYSGTRNAIPNKSELASTSLFIVFSVSNSTMNSTANRCSCRLPSTVLMLFLPALLFFLLGTGTSALETGSNDHTLTLPIREGMEDDKIYKRAQGYWQPAVRTKHGSFHVTCEKLTLDRTGLVSRILLWYISTRANRWCLAPPIQTRSILHAMGSVFLCGY